MIVRAVGQHADQARHPAVDACPVFYVRIVQPAAWAMGRMCSSKLVEPPNAAWITMAFSMAFYR